MDDGYPAFAALFRHESRIDGAPRYLRLAFAALFKRPLPFGAPHLYISLLWLSSPEAVEEVHMAAQRSSELDEELSALLDGINWRPHVVAATAIALGYGTEPSIEELWSTFDRGSWVTPQLAVAASMRDPEFESKAQSRIRNWRPPGPLSQDPMTRYHELYSLSGLRDPKALAALIYLCGLRPPCSQWLADLTTVPAIKNALAYDRQRDRGDRIAKNWLERITKVMREP
jgi:hypothetical protein